MLFGQPLFILLFMAIDFLPRWGQSKTMLLQITKSGMSKSGYFRATHWLGGQTR
jgi:hypothetical protein